MRTRPISLALLIVTASLLSSSQDQAFGRQSKEEIAAKARVILEAHCLECHGGKATKGGVKILDRELLVSKDKLAPGSAEDSLLYQLIKATDDSMMPPPDRPRLNAEEVAAIKAWIAADAPPFPEGKAPPPPKELGFGNEAILESILRDVRRIPLPDRKFARYFSIAHRLNAGAGKEELALEREALAKAINHLSWQTELVRPLPIERTRTVLRIDIRKLGWDKQPFRQVKDGKFVATSKLNLFDLALLEYPYGVVSHKSDAYLTLAEEFFSHADQARPIAYLRADWFVSTVTQPPLYEDFLQLPRTLKELETLLAVDSAANVASSKAIRAGMVQSGVSRNNRVVERHEGKYGAYWKSFDFQSSQGSDNIFTDLINLKPAGGEMIFTLPNGLQAYYITDDKGQRIDFAPTSVVTDANASDKTVRNGLSCMRCHDRGMKTFADVVRPTLRKVDAVPAGTDVGAVLKLYREQSELDALVKRDEEKFMNALEQLLGKSQTVEALKPASKAFLDLPLSLSQAGAEIGLNNSKQFQNDARWKQKLVDFGFSALLAGEYVPRDAWEGRFERLVRGLRLGIPLVPLDGLSAADHAPSSPAPFEIELKTNKSGNIFTNNDEIVIFVKPSKDVFIELIGTSARGRKVLLAPASTKVKAGTQFRFPPEGKSLKAKGGAGKEQITVFASELAFSDGELLRGDGVSDRVVHSFQVRAQGQQVQMECSPNPFQTVKKTIAIESR